MMPNVDDGGRGGVTEIVLTEKITEGHIFLFHNRILPIFHISILERTINVLREV